ncbi:MAG TPA: glycosyltransferase family 39 protein [Allocoleopsis sp.]
MFYVKSLKNKINLPLLTALLIATLLRLIFLSSIPNGFQQDEAAAGYDAYSLLKTLHTQYGQFLPLFSKTYEGPVTDYDESNYRFLIIPFIYFFGLNEFTTRLPAALIGILNILTLYCFAKEYFNQKVAITAALLLAICPWHIQLSRIAFRTILFPCVFCFSLFLFFKGLKKPNYLPLSGFAFGCCLYTYTSARVFVPLFLIGLAWIFRGYLWSNRKQFILASIIFILFCIFLFSYWISPELMKRTNQSICLDCIIRNPFKYIIYYLSYFYPGYLFFGQLSSRGTSGNVSLLLAFELITVGFGLFYLKKENKPENNVWFIWLLLYPIPSSLTIGADNVRSIIGVPLFSILSAYGLVQLSDSFKGSRKKFFRLATVLLLTVSLIIFFSTYFVGFSKKPPKSFQYGIREAINYAEKSSYSCVVVSDRFRRPNTMIIFYTQYPPSVYQRSPIEPATMTNYSVGKYTILSIDNSQVFNQQCLFMVKPDEIPLIMAKGYGVQDVHVVKDPIGREVIKLIEVKKE